MERSLRAASAIFAAGMAAMGVLTIARLDVMPALLPVPQSFPGRTLLVGLWGTALIAFALTILFSSQPRIGALALAALLSVSVLVHIRPVLLNPATPAWAVAFEAVVLSATAWILAGLLGTMSPAVRVGARWAFGVSLIAFGTFHFAYHQYIESVVPGWIPGHKFWTYAIGLALISAGLAILTGIAGRLAATLLSIMFGSWVFIVHAPRVMAAPTNAYEWSSMFIALACCGGSWIVRESLSRHAAPQDSTDYAPNSLTSAVEG